MSDLGGRLMQCRGFAAAEMERWFDVASCDLDAKPTPWATPHDPGAPPEVEDKRCE
jgi:hypothetical protein